MAISAGNLGVNISIKLRFSSSVIAPCFRVKRTFFIRYCGDYLFSGPVRYIPKKSSQIQEPKTLKYGHNSEETDSNKGLDSIPLTSKVFGAKRSQNGVSYLSKPKTVESNNIFGKKEEFLELEDEGNYEKEELIGLSGISHEKDSSQGGLKLPTRSTQDAEKIAIESLAKRAFTAVELRKKLQTKKIPLPIIDQVLHDLEKRGLIDDCSYAEAFSRSRWSSSTWGPRRIKQALHQKGVSKGDAEKAMKHVFEDDDDCGDDHSSFGMSKILMEQLFTQASKQWLRNQDVPLEKRKSRMMRWLQYRGFNWSITSFILKKLESKHPP